MARHRLVAMVAPVALAAAWLVPNASAHAAAGPTCHGLSATIVGTGHPDTLNGTDGPDVISGLGGTDRIRGLGGDDVICGGKGRDDLQGGDGNDRVYGARARDTLSGGAGDDLVSGGNGPGNIYTADAGDDTWVSGNIRDVPQPGGFTNTNEKFDHGNSTGGVLVDLPGGTASGDAIGHDTLQIHDLAQGIQIHGSPYDDEITTGPGPDAVFDNGGGTIDVGGGEDTVHQYGTDSSGPVTILGGTGADGIDATHDAQADLDGGPGADSFFLLSVAGSVTGSDGDDSVIADTRMGYQPSLSGGDGDDGLVLDFSWPSDMGTVTADLGAGEATSSVWGDLFPLTGFENLSVDLRGSSGRVGTYVLRGTDGDNDLTVVADGEGEKTPADLYGLGGDDRLLGGYGDDLLDGGPGHDLGQGNPGDDTCVSIEGPLSTHGTCEVIESRQ